MDLTNLTMGQACLVSLAGFLTVFTILLLISLIIRLNSFVIHQFQNGGSKSGKAAAAAAAGVVTSKAAGAPESEQLSEEELAALTAALAAVMRTGPGNLIIRDVRPAQQVYTPTWGMAARSDAMEELSWQ